MKIHLLKGLLMKAIFLSLFFIIINLQFAFGQPLREFDKPTEVLSSSNALFIITHADRVWDKSLVSGKAIDKVTECLKQTVPSVLLSNSTKPEDHFLQDRPDYLIESQAGEFHFHAKANNFYLAGGFMDACMSFTRLHIVRQFQENDEKVLKLNMVTDGIFGFFHYKGGGMTLKDFIDIAKKREFLNYVKSWLKTTTEYKGYLENEYENLNIEVHYENKFQFNYRNVGTRSKKVIINFVSSKTICK